MQFNFNELIKCINCEVLYKNENFDENFLFEISTDTRKIKPNDVYLPLRGENFDGHNFINKAIENGAIGYFTQDKFKINKNAKFVIKICKNICIFIWRVLYYISLLRKIQKKK